MGDIEELRRPEGLALNPKSTRFFRSMDSLSHLGKPLTLALSRGRGDRMGDI
jgi:hypothetical protein